jgi:hypothetical protein
LIIKVEAWTQKQGFNDKQPFVDGEETDLKLVELLLQQTNLDLNCADKLGQTPLAKAAANHRIPYCGASILILIIKVEAWTQKQGFNDKQPFVDGAPSDRNWRLWSNPNACTKSSS